MVKMVIKLFLHLLIFWLFTEGCCWVSERWDSFLVGIAMFTIWVSALINFIHVAAKESSKIKLNSKNK